MSFAATHLSNQCYTMCIRREAGFCAICYVATRDGINDNANNQQSFGLGSERNIQLLFDSVLFHAAKAITR